MGRSLPGKPLAAVSFLGLAISLILAVFLFVITGYSGRGLFSPAADSEEGGFYRKLRDYDAAIARAAESADADPKGLIRLLDGLEKDALGVEARLSTLKRRRALAAGVPPLSADRNLYLEAYRNAALRQAAAFPFSQPLAAIAAEASIRFAAESASGKAGSKTAAPEEAGLLAAAEAARDYGSLLADPSFLPLSMAIFILAGDMGNPGRAGTIPQGRERLEAFMEYTGNDGADKTGAAGTADVTDSTGTADPGFLAADAAILSLLRGDIREAGAAIRALLNPREPLQAAASGSVPSRNLRLAAEFFYDFGPPEQAAEIFSRFPDARSIARQADALWLSGRGEAARNLWFTLAAPGGSGQETAAGEFPPELPREILLRCCYNLAVTAGDPVEKNAWFERLLGADAGHVYGSIGYSRLMDGRRAIAFLEGSKLPEREGLADLELLRRRQEIWPIDRIIPETWLILGRHPDTPALYQWGAYFFDRQRQYGETAQLLRTAGQKGFSEPWISFHKAIGLIRDGNLDQGEALLRSIDGENAAWQIPANIGRILEAKRSPAAALEYYEIASSRVKDNREAAKLQLRIARCLRALGRDQESRRSLEYGKTLDGENLNIPLELERLGR
ncbi:MAG: hypothetical protein LBQ38_11840 [Spirochaetaceae bacterium]|jgi:tetratricopeptide (TPR) repeat protein|nr:hypothetical protein [Spirochaetaceae bacterium]